MNIYLITISSGKTKSELPILFTYGAYDYPCIKTTWIPNVVLTWERAAENTLLEWIRMLLVKQLDQPLCHMKAREDDDPLFWLDILGEEQTGQGNNGNKYL